MLICQDKKEIYIVKGSLPLRDLTANASWRGKGIKRSGNKTMSNREKRKYKKLVRIEECAYFSELNKKICKNVGLTCQCSAVYLVMATILIKQFCGK